MANQELTYIKNMYRVRGGMRKWHKKWVDVREGLRDFGWAWRRN